MPDAFSKEEQKRLTVAFSNAIKNKVIPSYIGVASFITDDYLVAARDTIGLYALPGGAAILLLQLVTEIRIV